MKTSKPELARRWHQFSRCEAGATAIEYGIIALLISVAMIAALELSGKSIGGNFDTVSESITNSTTD